MKRDLYDILELQKNATKSQIKKSYRKLSKKYHPDKTNGDKELEKKFKEVSEAYSVLENEENRKLYDQYGSNWEQAKKGVYGGFGVNPMQEFRRQQQERRNKGKSVHIEVKLTLEECYNGCNKKIDYTIQKLCIECGGNGAKNGTSIHTCSSCGGSGERIVGGQMGNIIFQRSETCGLCNGVGKVIDEGCPKCNRHGTIIENESVNIKIPRGVGDGIQIPAKERGHYSRIKGAMRGDAYFIIKEIPHENFERIGMDLVFNYKIRYEDLILGDKIKVPTISGKNAKINVSNCSKNGKVYRLKTHGMPELNLPSDIKPENANDLMFGNYLVILDLHIPENISDDEIELIKKIKKLKKINKN